MTPDDGKTEAKTPRPKNRRWRWNLYWLGGVAVALVVLAVGGWQAWLDIQRSARAAAYEPLGAMLHEFERRLASIEQRLETVANEEQEVVTVASNELWWINESERYLVEAAARLDSGAGVRRALAALRSASRTLESVELDAAKEARKMVEVEIRMLSEYKNIDAEQAVMIIDAALGEFARYDGEWVGPTGSNAAPAADDDRGNRRDGFRARLGDGLLNRLKRLVAVERKGNEEARRVARGVAMRSLMLARTAVLGGDDLSYRYAVANAMQAVEQSGVPDEALHDKLRFLYALDVAGKPPRIGTALGKVRTLARELTP